ncbi:hypothetical protein EV385_1904 [Krasilnikovia cinnamomea]|uniref:Flavin reductase n=1 Tax=Krasilnikovia cinnamomea TaxID=349313 RepID=A0A4Q7ZJ34_9ACTN|nr:hypothetical protein EV385_1904 [Krasilnikovia cinnamomea]
MMPGTASEHVAARPSWRCAECEDPWPCADARINLAEQHHGCPTSLTLYLASCMYDALEDLTENPGPVRDLYDRFLGWLR